MAHAPGGKLRITKKRDKVCYYHRIDEADRSGIYIAQGEVELAQELAQKEYNKQLLEELEHEMKALQQFKEKYHPEKLQNVYDSLNDYRKELVQTRTLSDEQFATMWLKQEYHKLPFDEDDETDFYADNGDRVRSKSEIMISNALWKKNILFKYECPVKLKSGEEFYPDFTCLNRRTHKIYLWEHLGMMTSEKYVNRNIKKIEKYILNGYVLGDNFITTMETSEVPLSTRVIDKMIEKYLL